MDWNVEKIIYIAGAVVFIPLLGQFFANIGIKKRFYLLKKSF